MKSSLYNNMFAWKKSFVLSSVLLLFLSTVLYAEKSFPVLIQGTEEASIGKLTRLSDHSWKLEGELVLTPVNKTFELTVESFDDFQPPANTLHFETLGDDRYRFEVKVAERRPLSIILPVGLNGLLDDLFIKKKRLFFLTAARMSLGDETGDYVGEVPSRIDTSSQIFLNFKMHEHNLDWYYLEAWLNRNGEDPLINTAGRAMPVVERIAEVDSGVAKVHLAETPIGRYQVGVTLGSGNSFLASVVLLKELPDGVVEVAPLWMMRRALVRESNAQTPTWRIAKDRLVIPSEGQNVGPPTESFYVSWAMKHTFGQPTGSISPDWYAGKAVIGQVLSGTDNYVEDRTRLSLIKKGKTSFPKIFPGHKLRVEIVPSLSRHKVSININRLTAHVQLTDRSFLRKGNPVDMIREGGLDALNGVWVRDMSRPASAQSTTPPIVLEFYPFDSPADISDCRIYLTPDGPLLRGTPFLNVSEAELTKLQRDGDVTIRDVVSGLDWSKKSIFERCPYEALLD